MGANKDFIVKNGATITQDLSVGGNAYLNALTGTNATFTSLTSTSATFVNTVVTSTSALSVINNGTGPALYVRQKGSNQPIAEFVDQEGGVIYFADTGNLGINTTDPNEKLTISGNVSATCNLSALRVAVCNTSYGGFISGGRDLADIFATTAGAGTIDGSGTANYLAKWSDSDTITNSIARESSTQLTVAGKLSATGALSAEHIAACNSSYGGFISGGRDLVDIFTGGCCTGTIDGSGTTCHVPYFSDANTIASSCTYFNSSTLVNRGTISGSNICSHNDICARGDLTTIGNISAGGVLSAKEAIRVPDNAYVALGNSDDLKIKHTGSESQIFNNTGQLDIRTPSRLLVTSSGGDEMIRAEVDGSVCLYYDDSAKLCTTNTGVNITGGLSAGGLSACNTRNGIVSAGRDLADIFVTTSGNVDGSGTANFLPSWSDSDTLTDSLLSGGTNMTRTTGSLSATTNMLVGGNIGVGTCAPNEKLTVSGNISSTGNLSADGNISLTEDQRIYFEADKATWIETDSADRLRFVAGGKQMLLLDQDTGDRAVFGFGTGVGINIGNNSLPNEKLTVAGNISATGTLSAERVAACNSSYGGFISGGRDLADIFATSSGNIDGSGTANFLPVFSDSNTIGDSIAYQTSTQITVAGNVSAYGGLSASRAPIYFACRVGIGTTAPEAPLHVNSTGGTLAQFHRSGTQLVTIGGSSNKGQIRFQYGSDCISTGATTGGDYRIDTGGSVGAGDNMFYVCKGGNVGIGTTAPNEKLTVSGNVSALGGLSGGTLGQASFLSGNLGIGTNRPTSFLHVSANKCIPKDLVVIKGGGAVGDYDGLKIEAGNGTDLFRVNQLTYNVLMPSSGKVGIGNTAPNEKLTVSGNVSACGGLSATEMNSYFGCSVGIGTTTPGEKLTVSGNISACGGLSATGSDNYFSGDVGIGCNRPNYGRVHVTQGANDSSSGIAVVNTGNGRSLRLWANSSNVGRIDGGGDGSGDISVNGAGSGNVAIGGSTAGVDQKLTVHGNISALGSLSAGLGEHFAACNSSYGGFISGGRDLADIFATSAGNIDGSGTTCHVPYFSDANTIASSCTYFNSAMLTNRGAISGSAFCTDGNGYFACVGIGTTTPNQKLTVAGNISACGGLSATKMNSYFGCNVGIGISTPTADLHIKDASGDPTQILLEDAAGGTQTAKIVFDQTAQNSLVLSTQYQSSTDLNLIQFAPADNVAMTIRGGTGSNDGNVGIGETVPGQKLTVSGNVSACGGLSATKMNSYFGCNVGVGVTTPNAQLHVSNSSSPTFRLSRTGTGQIWQQGIDSSGRFLLQEAASEGGTQYTRLEIDDAGDTCLAHNGGCVGIGTAGPEQKLTVAGNISACGGLSATEMNSYFACNVGIGINYPSYTIHVDGTARITGHTDLQSTVDISNDTRIYTKLGVGTNRWITPNEAVTVAGNISACNTVQACSVSANSTNGGFVSAGRDLADIFATSTGNVDGTGTKFKIPQWNDTDTLGDSPLSAVNDGISVAATKKIYLNKTEDTYIDSDSTDRLRAVAGGQQMLVLDYDTGNRAAFGDTKVAIGGGDNALPDQALTVAGNISACGGLSATEGDGYFACKVGIGINTNALGSRLLYVNGYTAAGGVEFLSGVTYTNAVRVCSLEDKTNNAYSKIVFGAANCNITFNTDATNQMLINAVGDVGIGTTSPNQKLTVSGNISALGSLSAGLGEHVAVCNSSYGGFISGGRDLADIFETCSSSVDGSGTANFLPLWSDSDTLTDSLLSGGTAMTRTTGSLSATTDIYAGGDVGIGTTTPGKSLDICSGTGDDGIRLCSTGSGGRTVAELQIDNVSNGTADFRLYCATGITTRITTNAGNPTYFNAGDIGIGTTTPNEKLTVSGNISACGGLSATKGVGYFACKVGIGTNRPNEKFTVSGGISATDCILLPDAGIIKLGNGADLSIQHDGNNSYITENGTGDMLIGTLNGSIFIRNETAGHTMIRANADSSSKVELYHGGDKKFETTNTGTKTTGSVCATRGASVSDGVSASSMLRGFVSAGRDLADIFATSTGNVDGSGTANFLPVWSDADTIGNSIACQSSTQLDVAGNLSACGGLSATEGVGYFACNVGIGTCRPASNLYILDDAPVITLATSDDTAHGIEWKANSGATFDACIKQTPSSGEFEFNVGRSTSWGGDFKFVVDTYDAYKIDRTLHRFYTGGSERMRINSDGNVGIKGGNPGQRLTVGGNISACGGLSATKGVGYFACKVGIGTCRPETSLDIYSSVDQQTFCIQGANSSVTPTARIRTISTGSVLLLETNTASDSRDILKAKNSAGTVFNLQADGKLGIGTEVPNETLTVAGKISALGSLSATNNITIEKPGTTGRSELIIKGNGNSSGDHVGMVAFKSYSEGDPLASIKAIRHNADDVGCMAFATSDSERVRIDNNGNVGIGETVPGEKLTVAGNISALGHICTTCCTVQGKIVRGTSCVVASKVDAQYISNLGEVCITSGCRGCVRLGTSQGWGMTLSANNDNVARVGIGGTVPGDEALTVSGNISAMGYLSAGSGINVRDSKKITLGDTHDLELWHNGSVSYVRDVGTGGLHLQTNGPAIYLQDTDGNAMAQFTDNGNSFLYSNHVLKFNTTNTGACVYGSICTSRGASVTDGVSATSMLRGFVSAGRDLADIFATSTGIDGSGTKFKIPQWNDTDTLSDSPLSAINSGVSVTGSISAQGYCSFATNTTFGTQALNDTSGGQNTAIGLQAMLANTSGYQNVAVGEAALAGNTEGLRNVAVGCGAAYSNTTGDCNVAVGCQAGFSNQISNSQVAIGSRALYNSTVGENVAVGSCALEATTTGVQNVAMGHRALDSNTIGKCNTAIGFNTLYKSVTACGNVAVGNYALYNNSCGEKNTAVGNCALQGNTEGWYNVAVGHSALHTNTTGEYNVAIGRQALNASTTADYNIGIGRQALWCNTTGCHNIALGQASLYCNETGCYNVAIGGCALNCNTEGYFNVALGCGTMYYANSGYHNNAIGYLALHCNFGGHGNNAIGRDALGLNTLGNCNDAMGYRALYNNTTGSNNVAIGAFSMSNAAPGDYNVAVGKYSLYNNTSTRNTGLGYYTLYNTTGADNTAVGYTAMAQNTSGYYNTAVGRGALQDNQTGNVNTAIGYCALHENEVDNNTGVGAYALVCNTTGSRNTAVGRNALCTNTTACGNTAVGYHAGFATCTGASNTAVGEYALCTNTTGCEHVAIGKDALCQNTTALRSTAVGYRSLYSQTDTGGYNTGLGHTTLCSITTGTYNTAAGYAASCKVTGTGNSSYGADALRNTTTGTYNDAFGTSAMYNNVDGCNNAAFGHAVQYSNTDGNYNTGLGHKANYNNCSGDFNTSLGAFALCNNDGGHCNAAIGYAAGRYLADGCSSNSSPDNNTYLGSCTRSCCATATNETVVGHCACGCGSNTVSIGNGCVTNTYINGTTTINGDVCANNGYFCCVIAGGYFEQKAANDTLACYPTGTLVVIGECGDLIQSTRENDKKVFGVTQNGVCQPIVLGAEPVLVTGDIKIGDYITTSSKPGHGKKARDPVYGSVIAQSMEAGTGNSHLVKAMIRKM